MEELIGKAIKNIYLSDNACVMYFETMDNEVISYAAEGDCCNDVWFETWENLEALIDCQINNVVELPMREVDPTRQECEEAYGHRLETNKGYALIEFRNSHNGYYGGSISYFDLLEKSILENRTKILDYDRERTKIRQEIDEIEDSDRFELMEFE